MFEQMNSTASGHTGRQQQQQPTPKPKKIDPSIGEYVEFEEFTETETKTEASTDTGQGSTPHTTTKTTSTGESRITDVEWEDL